MDEALQRAQAELEAARERAGVNEKPFTCVADVATLNAFERIALRALATRAADPEEEEAWRRQRLDLRRQSIDFERKAWARDVSGMPQIVLKQILNGTLDPDAPSCMAATEELEAGQRLVGLLGPTRTGKTAAGCWALWARRFELDERRLYEEHLEPADVGRFLTAPRFSRLPPWQIDDHWVMRTPMLVFDDLGRETEDKRHMVEEVLMQRYDADLVTVFTSNFSLEDFDQTYDERVTDRIRRVGVMVELEEVFDGS